MVQIHKDRFRGHPFPNRQQCYTTRIRIAGPSSRLGTRYALHQHPYRGEAPGMPPIGRLEDKPEAPAAFRGQLQPARMPLVEIGQRRDNRGHARATKRLINRPEGIAHVPGANNYEPAGRDAVLPRRGRIEVLVRVEQDDASIILRRGASIVLCTGGTGGPSL